MTAHELHERAAPYRAEKSQSEFQPLIEELYRQEVLEARQMPVEEKLILGEHLFRWACAVTLEGIRSQNPTVSDVECQRILRERIALGKSLGTL